MTLDGIQYSALFRGSLQITEILQRSRLLYFKQLEASKIKFIELVYHLSLLRELGRLLNFVGKTLRLYY